MQGKFGKKMNAHEKLLTQIWQHFLGTPKALLCLFFSGQFVSVCVGRKLKHITPRHPQKSHTFVFIILR